MVDRTVHLHIRGWPGIMSILPRLIAVIAAFALLLGDGGLAQAAPSTTTVAPDIEVDPVTPSAAAGGILMYKIQVHNDNTASEDLTRVDVTLRYDPNTLTLIDSKLRDKSDFVSKVEHGKATIQFGTIDQQDERSATLIFRVNPAAQDGAPILTDAEYRWRTADVDGSGGLSIDNVIAVSANAAAPAFIAPTAGHAGMIFQVGVTGFQRKEQVVTWLNMPTAVQGLLLSGKTSDGGDIQLQFDSAGLAPGYYSLVVHGLDSGREYLLPFVVTAQ